MAPWDLLDEGFRESNRQQADDIGRKLDAVACGIAPLYGLTGSRFAFSDDEIERMARLEHSRWMDERRRAGVRYAPGPSTSRTHPYLVDWESLPFDAQEIDRRAVREIPGLLDDIGFQIYRKHVADAPRGRVATAAAPTYSI